MDKVPAVFALENSVDTSSPKVIVVRENKKKSKKVRPMPE